jgi:hypothetical protein
MAGCVKGTNLLSSMPARAPCLASRPGGSRSRAPRPAAKRPRVAAAKAVDAVVAAAAYGSAPWYRISCSFATAAARPGSRLSITTTAPAATAHRRLAGKQHRTHNAPFGLRADPRAAGAAMYLPRGCATTGGAAQRHPAALSARSYLRRQPIHVCYRSSLPRPAPAAHGNGALEQLPHPSVAATVQVGCAHLAMPTLEMAAGWPSRSNQPAITVGGPCTSAQPATPALPVRRRSTAPPSR